MKRVSQNERKSKKKRRESIPLTIAQKKKKLFMVSGASRKKLKSKKWDKNIE